MSANITFDIITQMAFEANMGMRIMQSLTRAGADPTLPDHNGRTVAELAQGISAHNAELPVKGRNPTPAERIAIGLDPDRVHLQEQVSSEPVTKSTDKGKKGKNKKKSRRYDDDFDL